MKCALAFLLVVAVCGLSLAQDVSLESVLSQVEALKTEFYNVEHGGLLRPAKLQADIEALLGQSRLALAKIEASVKAAAANPGSNLKKVLADAKSKLDQLSEDTDEELDNLWA